MPHKRADNPAAIVVGGGPAGLTAAISLAQGGVDTALVGLRPAKADNRTTALLAGSVAALDTLGVWSMCAEKAAPLRIMRIVDGKWVDGWYFGDELGILLQLGALDMIRNA